MCRDDTKENRLRFLSVSLDKLKMACNIYAILFSSVVAQKKKKKRNTDRNEPGAR
ncbi:Uncharacterized protein APZ42_021717 [Daphnia magna]|uniref:Uncharacterized protein n=1 Tax=Daphnia magna TaxID=35525 RepID=A0A162C9W2_9CRUS|nr:Uncharacterized protein APZ42_021717 [Daphnia magna]